MNMPFFSRRSFPLLSLAVLLGAACSSGGGNSTGTGGSTTGTGGTSSTSTNSTTTSSTGGPATCPPGPGYMGSNLTFMGGLSATATIVDLSGNPAANVITFLCGTDICSDPGTTNAQGSVSVSWNKKMVQPVFKWGDTLAQPELGIPVTMASTTFTQLNTASFPATGAAFTPGGDAASGGVTISLPAGETVVVDFLTYDTPEKQQFRAVEIPIDKAKPLVDASGLGFEMVFGVTPPNTTFCPQGAKVTVPNTPNWPAGTPVEIYGQSLDTGQEWAPYGGWAKLGEGVVSADGKSVSTNDGAGISVLLTLGLRKKM